MDKKKKKMHLYMGTHVQFFLLFFFVRILYSIKVHISLYIYEYALLILSRDQEKSPKMEKDSGKPVR